MVPAANLTAMAIQILLSIALPVGAIIYLVRKKRFSWKAFGIGILVFILFSQILEQILHVMMIDTTTMTLKWSSNPYLFALYGALAAGVFEEMGRYFAFKFALKKQRSYNDGISLGIGHGGIEAVLIGVLGAVNTLVIAFFINAGIYDQVIGSALPGDQAATLKNQVIETDFWMFLLGGTERIFAFIIQIAFSLLVLIGVRSNKFKYVLYAIGLHALLDIFAALYQVKVIPNILLIEGIVMVFTLAAAYFIYRSKKSFSDN
jgi:uncharacterized membrane protein YhfC